MPLRGVIHAALVGVAWQGRRMQEEGGWKMCWGSPGEGVVSEIPIWNLFLLFKKKKKEKII